MIIPPSLVATIFERMASAAWASEVSCRASASPWPSFAARAPAWSRTAMIASTAQLMWLSSPDNRLTSSNCARRSSAVYVARGSIFTSSFVVYTWSPLVILTVYVPGSTRGPSAAPKSALAAGGTLGGFSRIDHPARFRPRRLLLGTTSTSLPALSRISIFRSPNTWRLFW